MKREKPRCAAEVYWNHGFSRCSYTGKVERDGKFYCGIHDPVAVEARKKARDDKWRSQYEARRASMDRRQRITEAKDEVIRCARLIGNGDPDRLSDLLAAVKRLEDAES